uniref:Uncharacterized protein n=1 Tax=Glossina morsitans morsitans TaxID=37546 RepID=A0A1B0FKJ2_GLOMM
MMYLFVLGGSYIKSSIVRIMSCDVFIVELYLGVDELRFRTAAPKLWQLDLHLTNGQRVYFSATNVKQITLHLLTTTISPFFTLCQHNAFAKTLLCSEMPTYYTQSTSNKSCQRRKQVEQTENQTL